MSQSLALKLVVGIVSMIPIFVGLNGIFRGPSMLEAAFKYPTVIDSHFRYLSGIPVAMGLILLRSLPTIDQDGSDLRRISFLIFIGGLGRFWGLIAVSCDSDSVLTTLIELLVFPLLCFWQNRIQKTSFPQRQKYY